MPILLKELDLEGTKQETLIMFTTDVNLLYCIILLYSWTKPWAKTFGCSGYLQLANKQYCFWSKANLTCSFSSKFLSISSSGPTWALREVQWTQVRKLIFLSLVRLFFPQFSLLVILLASEVGQERSSGDFPPLCPQARAVASLAGCLWLFPQSLLVCTPHTASFTRSLQVLAGSLLDDPLGIYPHPYLYPFSSIYYILLFKKHFTKRKSQHKLFLFKLLYFEWSCWNALRHGCSSLSAWFRQNEPDSHFHSLSGPPKSSTPPWCPQIRKYGPALSFHCANKGHTSKRLSRLFLGTQHFKQSCFSWRTFPIIDLLFWKSPLFDLRWQKGSFTHPHVWMKPGPWRLDTHSSNSFQRNLLIFS